jgi:cyanamide hydratase
MADPIKQYGLTAIPADQSKLSPATKTPQPILAADLKPPTTAFCSRINDYTRAELSEDTYRHSLRVYSYGVAIAQQCFPDWGLEKGGKLDETWFACAMLHDIGTTDKNISSTRLSYEFFAGYLALDLLQKGEECAVASKDQAESVAEAIIRHQDIQPVGNITLLTGLIHFGTLLDNIGAGSHLIHEETIANIVAEYPRKGWSGCFRHTVETEKKLKPYTMVSRIDGFEEKIAENGRGGATGKYDQ